MSYITIPNLICFTKIGTKSFEQSKISKLIVDIKIPIVLPIKDDKIDNTVDYEAVANFALSWSKSKSYNLLETYIYELATELKKSFKLDSVIIKVQKTYAINLQSHVEIDITI
jgi:dihydroneopterin aldolase